MSGPARDASPILDAYLLMMTDPTLHEPGRAQDSEGADQRGVGGLLRRARRFRTSS